MRRIGERRAVQQAAEAVGRGLQPLQPGERLCSVRGVVDCSRGRILAASRWADHRRVRAVVSG